MIALDKLNIWMQLWKRRIAGSLARHTGIPSDFRPRLLVDVSVLYRHDAGTGIQRVVRAIWQNLLDMDGLPVKPVPVVATRKNAYRILDQNFLFQIPRPKRKELVLPQAGDIFLGLDLAANILPHMEWQLKLWKSHGVAVNVVVYDLLPLTHPDWFNPSTTANFRRWIGTIARQAGKWLCISSEVARHANEHLDTMAISSRPEVDTFSLSGEIATSAPSSGKPDNAKDILAIMLAGQSVLMVATLEPRKAHSPVLAAFDHLWAQNNGQIDPVLVLVGKKGWKTEALQIEILSHPEQGKRLFWLDRVSDEYLGELYNASTAVIVPSYAEGFGLPLVEAIHHGKPVLARDLPVFREMQAKQVAYFSDDGPSALAQSVAALLDGTIEFAHGEAVGGKPDWRDCTVEILLKLGIDSHSLRVKDCGASDTNDIF